MGNICGQARRDEDNPENSSANYKDSPICQFQINKSCKMALILGTYHSYQADLLLVFAQLQFLEYCSEIRDYAQNYLEMIELATINHKKLFFVDTNKRCPYKKLVVAMMPRYNNLQAQTYFQNFKDVISQVMTECSQFALQLYITPQNGNGVPNQTLISLFINQLQSHTRPLKVSLISSEMRILNMVKYEMAKLGTYIHFTNRSILQ